MLRPSPCRSLAEHPRRAEVLEALERLPFLGDAELMGLAECWRNGTTVATARRRALHPDQPLVLDILAAFDLVSTLYADEVAGRGEHTALPPEVVRTALKAVRDGIAALYARPSLTRWEASALSAPWRRIVGKAPARGHWPAHLIPAVDAVIGTSTALTARCHTPGLARTFDAVVAAGMTLDEGDATAALDAAWDAAVFSGRHRVWALLRRGAIDGLGSGCRTCRRPADAEDERVGILVADAACGLLVRDLVDGQTLRVLTEPVRLLRDGLAAAGEVAEN